MFRFIGPQNPTRSLGLCRVVWNNMRRLFQNREVFADFEIGAAADLLSLFLTNVAFIWRPRLSSDFPMWPGTRTLLNGIFVRTP